VTPIQSDTIVDARLNVANQDHVNILKQGVEAWNKWRQDNPGIRPDLSQADLSGMYLSDIAFGRYGISYSVGVDLRNADLTKANLSGAVLAFAQFSGADLSRARLVRADLIGSEFETANLRDAWLINAKLGGTTLTGADLSRTLLDGADFTGARLYKTNFTNAAMGRAIFGANDLSLAIGLETILHTGPSTIGMDTLYASAGNIPEVFLRGCGVPDDFITFIPSHFGVKQAIQFYSCFISHSTKDEDFAKRLYSRMRDEHLRVWFAPEDMKGGRKLFEQIERAIQVHDRLLLVLSENSMQSEWVLTEIRNARRTEVKEGRRKLFPIRLAAFDAVRNWKCFDAETGKDLAIEVREYFIPDFSNWKEHEAFETAFARLIRDLRIEEVRESH
jgi:uncharacterized protein YjbI with pentapeptide repeats